MLLHPTLEKLSALRLTGMVAALDDQRNTNTIADLGFEERLGLLLDREQAVRDTRRMQTKLRITTTKPDYDKTASLKTSTSGTREASTNLWC